MDGGKIARVLQDFLTSKESELSLQKGDIVVVLNTIDKFWCFGCHNGRRGNMPLSYLIPIDYPVLKSGEELFVAMDNFSAQRDGDLSFEKGDLIVGILQADGIWWQGKHGSRSGLFPSTLTWQLDSSVFKKTFSPPVNLTALVLTDMNAQLNEEVDLYAGDFITVLEIIDKNWYRGVSRGRSGVFPAAFVSLLKEDARSPPSNCLSSTSYSTLDKPSSYSMNNYQEGQQLSNSDVFGNPVWSTSPKSSCRTTNTYNVLDDEYFKLNAPTLLFNDQKDQLIEINEGKQNSVALIPYGISLYSFNAQYDNELSFKEGEIVTLIRYVSSGWMEGKVNEKRGIFPSDYVNIIVDCCKDDSDSSTINSMTGSSIVCIDVEKDSFAVVLYDFKAQMKGDLNLKEEEVVYVIEIVNESWCKVQKHTGEVGLCPRNYLTSHGNTTSRNSPAQKCSLVNDSLLEESPGVGTGVSKHSSENSDCEDFVFRSRSERNIDGRISLDMSNIRASLTWLPSTSADASALHEKLTRDCNEVNQDKNYGMTPFFRKQNFDENVETLHSVTEDYSLNIQQTHCHQNSSLSLLDISNEPTPVSVLNGTNMLHGNMSPISTLRLRRQISDRVPHRPAPPVPRITEKYECSTTKTSLEGNETFIKSSGLLSVPSENTPSSSMCNEEGRRVHHFEQRQNVISELVMTEKEYVRDLKATFEVFNLHDSSKLENYGIDVKTLFSNIFDVMRFAEGFLDKLLLGMKGKEENEQCIGIIFLDSTEEMRSVYGEYCMNHDNALSLLEKYECEPEIHKIFSKGLETLRYQIACFDMSSILIKPVQRILKYPLILNELIKFTDDSHKDKAGLMDAVKAVMDVATCINECKRRKDIVSKYLLDGNSTISSKMSRISLHSVAKKSTRLGMLVTSSLGFGAVTKDPAFGEYEAAFHASEKSMRLFLKNLEYFVQHLREVVVSQCYVAEGFAHFYQETHPDVEDFAKIQKLVYSQYFKEFESCVHGRVFEPLNMVLNLFEGPAILVQKRHDKFLDYNACVAKAEKNKEVRMIQEELSIAKNNYIALNEQLLEELPCLISISNELFVECLSAFITARKLFTAKVMKKYLSILEQSKTISNSSDVVESCCVRYNLVLNQICRLSFVAVRKSTYSATPKLKQSHVEDSSLEFKTQSSSQRSYLLSLYSQDMLCTVIKPCYGSEPAELSLHVGHLVGVIKKQNPLGNCKIWLVDDGATKGFVPCINLKQTCTSEPEGCSVAVTPSFQLSPQENKSQESHIGSLKRGSSTHECRDTDGTSNYCFGVSEEIAQLTDYSHKSVPEREVYYAMYDFQGDEDRTLTLRIGEALIIIQKQDAENNHEWWLVENSLGKRGFVPANFVNTRK